MKLLSIIVPAYNMETYLTQCVESVLRTPSLAAIEIVIVNDGSRDRTLRIAKGYAERYADTVRVIDKENGNYGSTINAALPTLQGRYVKILDADDSFDGGRVAEMLDFLRRTDADMVVTPFVEVGRRRERRVEYNIYGRKVYDYGKVYDADKVFADGAIRFFMMHGVCYRTELLRDISYHQTEGISYTDQEWVFYPLFRVKSIAFADIALYRYNTSREGQTMDAKVQMRSINQLVALTECMAQHFILHSRRLRSAQRATFLRNIVADRVRIVYRKYLLAMDDKLFADSGFELIDLRLMRLLSQCHIKSFTVPVNNLLRVDLLRYWQRHNRRFGAFVRWVLRCADGVMTSVHSWLFR